MAMKLSLILLATDGIAVLAAGFALVIITVIGVRPIDWREKLRI